MTVLVKIIAFFPTCRKCLERYRRGEKNANPKKPKRRSFPLNDESLGVEHRGLVVLRV